MMNFKSILRQLSTKKFKVGDKVAVNRIVTTTDLKRFIELSGDDNPVHSGDGNEKAVVHGAFLNSLVSGVIGTRLPGPGTLVISQNLNFPRKCYVDENVQITVELVEDRKILKVKFSCEVVDDDKPKVVLFGDARLMFVNYK